MFEDMTKDKILSDLLSQAPDGIDTREGSIFYDAVKGAAMEIAKFYVDLNILTQLIFIDTAGGEFLDKRAAEYGIIRKAGEKAEYNFSYTGSKPIIREKYYYNGMYFDLGQYAVIPEGESFPNPNTGYFLRAAEVGEEYNQIISGTPAIPVNPLTGMTSSTFGEIIRYGCDAESDEALRARIKDKISGPAENGNKANYKSWCEEIEGVGRAEIIPLWNGPNTVKGVLTSTDGRAISNDIVEEVQEYIDPDSEGLGEGVANIGAHFTAVSAVEKPINVTVSGVCPNSGYSSAQVTEEITRAINKYLQDVAVTSGPGSILATVVGSKIAALSSVNYYTSITLNSGQSSVTVLPTEVGVAGTIVVNIDAEE